MAENPKMLIEVRGGLIQSIFCDLPVEVVVVDWDASEIGDVVEGYDPDDVEQAVQSSQDTKIEITPMDNSEIFNDF